MKALKYGISLALFAGFALTASCGGSSDPAPDATAGASNSGGGEDNSEAGGTARAGATARAGSPGNNAGAPGAAGDDTTGEGGAPDESGGAPAAGGKTGGGGAGGKASGGGAGGAPAAGGAGGAMNPMGCPATAPTDATACTEPANQFTTCQYTGSACQCRRVQGGGAGGTGGTGGTTAATREWSCNETLVCPAAAPMDGAACGMLTGNCAYTGEDCRCGNSHNWACTETLTCPATKPATGDACNANGRCPYQNNGACTCINKKFTCTGGNANACPATQPTVGSACTGNTQCTYGANVCGCLQQKWGCT